MLKRETLSPERALILATARAMERGYHRRQIAAVALGISIGAAFVGALLAALRLWV